MQVSRHWRLNAQRYRLEGIRYANGEVSLLTRPTLPLVSQPRQSEKPSEITVQPVQDSAVMTV